MSIARHVAVVGTATLASRLLGFVRDVAIAGLFGAGARADAFVVAFQFSNLIRRLLTEGALNSAFVPLYLRKREESGSDLGGEAAAAAFAGKVTGTITLFLIGLSLLLALAMPLLMFALAPGFSVMPARMSLVIELSRLMLPYLVLAGPIAVLMGVLNANHRFAAAALTAVMFNAVILTVIAVIVFQHWGDSDLSAQALAIAVAIAGLCQLALVGIAVWMGPQKATPLGLLSRAETRSFTALAIPALIATSIPQLTMIAAAVIASDWPGAVAYLYYANRLIDLPLSLVGIAVGTVMTPALSHAMRSDDHEIAPRTIQRGIELSLGLALPAAIGLFVLGWPIVRILFERGAFTSVDSRSTTAMLVAFAIGLPGHVLVKTLSPVFFAREDTRTPMLVTLLGLALAVIGSIAFMRIGRPTGIALSIALSGWFGAVLLYGLARRRKFMDAGAISWRRLSLITLAAILTGILAGIFGHYLGLYAPDYHLQIFHAVILATVIAFAIALYLSCLWLFGVIRASDLPNT